MLQSDPSQWPMGISHSILPPHFIGGVAPSRQDVALAAYLEKQAAQRAAILAIQANPKTNQLLWGILLQVARRAAGAVWRPQHRHFESALK
jgi:hypothetical protein